MPLSRLENFLRSVRGNIIYVDPNALDSTDSIENDGTSAARPFKTLQRALIEAARFSYLPGKDNDKFANTTILLYPGEHLIDNRPGWIPLSGTSFLRRDGTTSSNFTEFNLQTNFDITTDNNILYKFNSIHGGVIIPRGTSIVGYDLRKTKIRPKYVPNPENDNIERSAIFRLTGGCYIWQMSIFDANPNGQCFKDYTTNKFVPNFSHHKLTSFEYADGVNPVKINDAFIGDSPTAVIPSYSTTRTDLDIYYEKIGLAYGDSSGRRILPNYPDEVDIESKIDEYRIVGSRGAEVGISSIISGDGITPTTEITVTLQESLEGLDVDTPIRISGVNESGYNGQYVVSKVLSNTEISYNVSNPPSIPISGSEGTLSIVVDTVTSASPYIFNCSLRSVYGLCGIHADGSVVTGFKSIVVAQFTGISLQKDNNAFVKYDETTDSYIDSSNVINIYSDSLAQYKPSYESYHIKASNNAFIQAVSIFAIGYASHFLGESGGDMSITNSNSNFGARSLISKGFRSDKFIRDDIGYISHIIPPKEIENKLISLEFYSIDAETTRTVANISRIYLYDTGNETSPPISTLEGHRIGARKNDQIYVSTYNGSTEIEYSALIAMQGNLPISHQKEYEVDKQNNINIISNNIITLKESHDLYNGETVRVYSDIGEMPNGIDINAIYYAITDVSDLTLSSNQIRLAASLNDAENSIPITIYNTTTSNLKIVSRVSDKKSGDPGHPIQYDSGSGKWFITVESGNTLYDYITSSTVEVTSRSYIKRILDKRSSEDSIYKFRYIIPKNSQIKARPPVDGFIIQESTSIPASNSEVLFKYSSNGISNQLTNSEQLRNTRFISNALYSNGIATIQTEQPHHLNIENSIEILNILSSNNVSGLSNKGFNGTFIITDIPSRREFSYVIDENPGTFINNTSNRTTSLPFYNRKKLSKTYVAYESELIQEYIQNQQDGIYYIKVVNSSNSPKVSPFNGYKFLQPIKNLYPQRDRDNLISDPLPSNSFALSSPIGQVTINDPERSATKETLESFLSNYRVGFGITDIVSNETGTVYTIYTDIDHGLNPITSLTIENPGSAYGSNVGNETLYNADLSGGSGEGASALIRINTSGVIQSLELINGGSGYETNDVLSVVGVATTTGHVPATVSVASIYNHNEEIISISGISSEKYTDHNNLYRITDVVNSREVLCSPSSPISLSLSTGLGNVEYKKIYGYLTGKSILCSSVTYNSSTQTATAVFSQSHGLIINDKFRLSGSSNSIFNNDFIVSKVNNLTSIDFYVGAGYSPQVIGGTIRLYYFGITSKGGDNVGRSEDRLLSQYYGVTSYTSGVIGIIDDQISIQNLSSLGLKIGDYIKIDNEIIRIKETVKINPVKVFRGLLGTRNFEHASGALVRKIYPYPIEFRRHSILRASGHTFEYVGYGPGNYSNAFPDRQDRQISKEEELLSQSFKLDGGINIYTGMNNDGDFYIGNKIINSSTGNEDIFDAPVPLVRGEDDLEDKNLINFTTVDKINITSSLHVDGGKNKNNITEFNGPVIFNNKIVSNSERGIEGRSLYLQGDETVSRKYSVGISTPTVAATPGDIVYYSNPEEGGYLGWVYTINNSWRKFGPIQDSNNQWIFGTGSSQFLTVYSRIGIVYVVILATNILNIYARNNIVKTNIISNTIAVVGRSSNVNVFI